MKSHARRDVHLRVLGFLFSLLCVAPTVRAAERQLEILPGDPIAAQPSADSASGTWTELAPPARTGHAAIFDSQHRRWIVFGGAIPRARSNALWVLDLTPTPRWHRAEPLGDAPSPRSGAAAVYDAARGRMLIIGGEELLEDGSTRYRNDVWELSLRGRMRWRQLSVTGIPPTERAYHSATLDPEHDRVLLFGGGRNYADLGDSTLWQLTLQDPPRWTRLPALGPAPRTLHSATYVPDLHGIVLFGGMRTVYSTFHERHDLQDVWFLSTSAEPAWTDFTPTTTGPPPCHSEGLASIFDPTTHVLVYFGGFSWGLPSGSCFGPSAGAWVLSLANRSWRQLAAGASPRSRALAVAALDPALHRMLIFGGSWGTLDEAGLSDTWALDLGGTPRWTRVVPASDLPPRSGWLGHPAIYDRNHERMVTYQEGTLWAYSLRSGGVWEPLLLSGVQPLPRVGALVVHDTNRNRLLLIGGFPRSTRLMQTEVWAMNLDPEPAWSRIDASGRAPTGEGFAGIYDPARDRVVLYDGGTYPFDQHGVWELALDGAPRWTQRVPAQPGQSRAYGSAVLDSRRDQLVFFGGGFATADGWIGSNAVYESPLTEPTRWDVLLPGSRDPGSPEPRLLQTAAYDATTDKMMVIGGFRPGYFSEGPWPDLWTLDLGSRTWARIDQRGDARPLWSAPVAAYDAKRHRFIVSENDATFELDLEGGSHIPTSLAGALVAEGATVATVPSLSLRDVRPHPIRGPFVIQFALPDGAPASIDVLDVSGRLVWNREVGSLGAGDHEIRIEPDRRLPAGVYFLRLEHGQVVITRRLVRLD